MLDPRRVAASHLGQPEQVQDLEAGVFDGRLVQGSAQVARGHARRATAEGRSTGGDEHGDGVLVARRAGGKQVHRDRRRTRASRSKDPSSPAVKFSPHGLGHLFSDRRPGDRVHEPDRLAALKHRRVGEIRREQARLAGCHPRERRSVADTRLAAESRYRPRETGRRRAKPADAHQQRRRDALRPELANRLCADRPQGLAFGAQLGHELGEEKRVARRRGVARGAQLRPCIVAELAPNELPYRGRAQRPWVQRGTARLERKLARQLRLRPRLARPDCKQHSDAQPFESSRQVQQEPQRGIVAPVDVVDC